MMSAPADKILYRNRIRPSESVVNRDSRQCANNAGYMALRTRPVDLIDRYRRWPARATVDALAPTASQPYREELGAAPAGTDWIPDLGAQR